MGEQAFGYNYFCVRVEGGLSIAQGRIDSRELDHLHLAVRALLHRDLGHGVQYALTRAVALAVVLFNIFDFRIFADKEAVYTVVLGLFGAAIVYPAARDYKNVRALADIEVVINRVVDAGLCKNDGDMYLLALCERLYVYIYAGLAVLWFNGDIFARLSYNALAVFSYVQRALGQHVHVGYGVQQR